MVIDVKKSSKGLGLSFCGRRKKGNELLGQSEFFYGSHEISNSKLLNFCRRICKIVLCNCTSIFFSGVSNEKLTRDKKTSLVI